MPRTGYDGAKLRKLRRQALGDGIGTVVPIRMDAALLEALRMKKVATSRSTTIAGATIAEDL